MCCHGICDRYNVQEFLIKHTINITITLHACHSSDVIACSPFIGIRARAFPGKFAAN